jgi:hypothetical protein
MQVGHRYRLVYNELCQALVRHVALHLAEDT